MNAMFQQALKRCGKCRKWRPREIFNKNAKARDGLQCYCRECASLDKAERQDDSKPVKEYAQPAVVLPAMSLLERLECRRLARWAKCVETNPRFGVAMIGGGYV